MAKKATKGYYARERDARAAALKQGLKEGEFHIDYGPKGHSITKKKEHPPVTEAKLHGIGQPDSGEQEPVSEMFEPTDSKWIMKEKVSGRFRWVDETGGYSNESYETQSQAKIALDAYVRNSLGTGNDPVPSDKDDFHGSGLDGHPHDPDDTVIGGDTAESDPPGIDDEYTGTPIDIKEGLNLMKSHLGCLQNIPKTESRMCSCNQVVPTWINGAGVLCYIEHTTTDVGLVTDNQLNELCSESEEPVKNVPISIKVSELPVGAPVTVAARTEATTPGGTTPSTRSKKSTIIDPSKSVWHIADEMFKKNPATSRKDVVAACVASGIAFFTARTQYQQWFTARRESAQHAAEANAKKE